MRKGDHSCVGGMGEGDIFEGAWMEEVCLNSLLHYRGFTLCGVSVAELEGSTLG